MQPKVYSLDEHRIPPNKIDNHVFYIIEKLRQAGFLSFLVGGGVRDLLLNVRPKDFDISTSAKPEEIKRIFKHNCILIGRRFRLAHIRFGRKIIEVSTFRSGDVEDSSLILRDNQWGSPEQDVLRRDFTINGLFYDPEVQTVIDYVGGFEDIEKKILRTIGKSEIRFIQDPVRMIRLLKFKARFDLQIEDETLQALLNCKKEIVKSSPARILEELFRMLESGSSRPFFDLLNTYGLLSLLMPFAASFIQKNKTIYEFLEQVDILTRKHPQKIDRSLLISALIFPILEEVLKKEYIDKNKKIHLGIIIEAIRKTIDQVFKPFFLLPKKIKSIVTFILVNQYRILPLEPFRKGKIRVPHDPFFPLALEFFNLRCMLNSDLVKIYAEWNEAFVNSHKHIKKRNHNV
ncbi:MAG: polynucleotide adenylyltransferase PcnB [Chlamydiae bacterium]|nr:polynucleotide adenylyltransferase PcnB [Chlamydiota bacterium]